MEKHKYRHSKDIKVLKTVYNLQNLLDHLELFQPEAAVQYLFTKFLPAWFWTDV